MQPCTVFPLSVFFSFILPVSCHAGIPAPGDRSGQHLYLIMPKRCLKWKIIDRFFPYGERRRFLMRISGDILWAFSISNRHEIMSAYRKEEKGREIFHYEDYTAYACVRIVMQGI